MKKKFDATLEFGFPPGDNIDEVYDFAEKGAYRIENDLDHSCTVSKCGSSVSFHIAVPAEESHDVQGIACAAILTGAIMTAVDIIRENKKPPPNIDLSNITGYSVN